MQEERQNRRAAPVRVLVCALQALCLVGALNRYFFRDTAFSAFNDRPFHASSILNVFAFAALLTTLNRLPKLSSPTQSNRTLCFPPS